MSGDADAADAVDPRPSRRRRTAALMTAAVVLVTACTGSDEASDAGGVSERSLAVVGTSPDSEETDSTGAADNGAADNGEAEHGEAGHGEAGHGEAGHGEADGDPTGTGASSDDRVRQPEGFASVAATVTDVDGAVCELCLWLADDPEERARGLMMVDDLGDADGMAFVYPVASERSFWMRNTVLPLSIAFFGPDGEFVDAFDMEPCTDDPCPRYPTPETLVAVEVPHGELATFGIGPGSALTLTDTPCP